MNFPPESTIGSPHKANFVIDVTTAQGPRIRSAGSDASSASRSAHTLPQVRQVGSRHARRCCDEATWRGVFFVAAILIIDSGVPALLIGLDSFTLGRLMTAGLIAIGLLIPQLHFNRNFSIQNLVAQLPLILMAIFVIVSVVSNMFIFGYGFENFAPSFYLLMPVLSFYLFRNLGVSSGDVIWGVIVSAIFAATVVLADMAVGLPALRQIRRLSVFGEEGNTDRLVILKDACVLALILLVANVFTRKKRLRRHMVYGVILALIAFPLFVTFESRFAIVVSLLSIALFVLFGRMTVARRVSFYTFGLLVGIPGAWLALEKFITPLLSGNWDSYAQTNNVSVRIDSLNYYAKWFEDSYYFGIGHMSTSPAYKNILSNVVQKAFNLNDLGIYASLFQFGIFGLIITIFMTIYLAVSLLRLGYSGHPRAAEMHILGCYVLASFIQVVPANLFTLTATCIYGSMLWYLMCRARFEEREAQLQIVALAR